MHEPEEAGLLRIFHGFSKSNWWKFVRGYTIVHMPARRFLGGWKSVLYLELGDD